MRMMKNLTYSLLNFHHNVNLNRTYVLHVCMYEYNKLLNKPRKKNIIPLIDLHLSSTKHNVSINKQKHHKNNHHLVFAYFSILYVVLQYVLYQRNLVKYF